MPQRAWSKQRERQYEHIKRMKHASQVRPATLPGWRNRDVALRSS